MGVVMVKKEMTHKERVFSTIQRKPIDKHPVQFDFAPAALDKVLDSLKLPRIGEEALLKYMDNHIVYAYLNDVFGQIRRRKSFTEPIIYDEWGVGWDTTQEGTFFCYHPLEDRDAFTKYEFPDPHVPYLMDIANEVVPKYSDEYVVSSYQVNCLFERAYALRGFENFLVDMMVDKDFAETLLDKLTDYQIELAKRYIKAGVNCGRTGDDYGGQDGMLMSPQLWREMIKPRLKRVWKVYQDEGLPIIHHSCGDVRPIIPDFIEMGLDVLHPIQPQAMPIDELAQKYGDKITFYGGICTQKVLPYGTPEEVDKEVKRCIDVLGEGLGYILAPSVGITSDVPMQNIHAMLKASEKYRNI
jgi:uroporphyrinogen decarboxylase